MKTTNFYGFNPSGGVHRASFAGDQMIGFVTFMLVPHPHWMDEDYSYYKGWIDWASLEDMPPEVRAYEASNTIP